jgi:type I restriction enzyme S subunit
MKMWTTKRIGDVCDLATGGTPSRSKPEYFGGDIKWLVSGDIHQGEIFDCEGRITEAGMRNSNAKLLPPNSVMIALNGQGKTRATVALLRTAATCNQSMVCMTPKVDSGLLPEFLHANLHGRYEEIRRLTSDDDKDRRGLNMGIVRSIEIPIAPLAEQQRIVEVLDEAFAGLATAEAHAAQNLQNARALFESHLQAVFTQRGPGWVEKPFEDCIEDVTYTKKVQRKEFLEDGMFPIVSQEAEFTNGYWNNPADVFKVTRPVVIFGDHTQVLKFIDFDFVLGADGVKILPPKPFLNPKFFFYALRSMPLKSLGYARHYRLLKELRIGFPESNAQAAIVTQLDALSAETQRLAGLYERKRAALEALKKSLLHQAFAGEL